MSKKYSDAGKGDKSRVTDKKKYADNWEKIFSKKKKRNKVNLPEIETIEDMDTQMSISHWDLINVAEEFQRKGFYIGIFTGLGLVGLFALLRNVI